MNYTEARANPASVLDSATEDLEEVVITRAGREPAVVVALSATPSTRDTSSVLSRNIAAQCHTSGPRPRGLGRR
ncbi:type II toxin-antitoxin system Phd/YefM family antitoxin [Nocardia sp. NPDC004168]|uniref:type II toxin-antitoxin system Phd/YefM family antitoxin n=1 Tax=Nocardia sp. NPDC004168 TaxID=3154452 RepID=UPI0033BF4C6B